MVQSISGSSSTISPVDVVALPVTQTQPVAIAPSETAASQEINYQPLSLGGAIAQYRQTARFVTQCYGPTSPEAAVAWEQFDELLSARSRTQKQLSSLDRYCKLNPYAPECRIYDV